MLGRNGKTITAPIAFHDALPSGQSEHSSGMTSLPSESLDATPAEPPKACSTFRFDPSKYEHHLARLDLTDSERRDVIESLKTVMESFVAWGYGEDSTIAALNAARAEGSPHASNEP